MSWGKYFFDIDNAERPLYWALLSVFRPFDDRPLDYLLKKILAKEGHAGGDPGWEIEHITEADGSSEFFVWTNPDISGLEPSERKYSEDVTMRIIKLCLLEFADAYPNRAGEVNAVLQRYGLR